MKQGMFVRGVGVTWLLHVVACGSTPKPVEAPEPASTAPVMPLVLSSLPHVPAPPPTRCGKIHAENERALAELGIAADAAARLDFCQEDKRGAWAVSLAKARKDKADLVVAAELVRFDQTGGETRAALPFPKPSSDPKDALLVRGDEARAAAGTQLGVRTVLPFDFDGDGTPELAISTETYVDNFGKSARAFVFAAKSGAIEPYGPTKELVLLGNIGDVNGDGRPDFATAGPFVGLGHHPGADGVFPVVGPVFGILTRSDGSLSVGDDALPSRSNCGPNQKDMNDPKHRSLTDYALAVACNRVWSTPDKTMAEALGKIEKDCPKKVEGNAPEVCANLGLLRTWSKAASPVHEGSRLAAEPVKTKGK